MNATHSSSRRYEWDPEPDDEVGSERIVPFRSRPRRYRDDPELSEPDQHEATPPRATRRRQQATQPDSMPRYLLTALGMFLAVAALGYLLFQLGQVGRQTPQPSLAAATGVPLGAANTVNQPTPAPAPRTGSGPLRTTQRVLEPAYTVAPGDTLGSIAARFGTTVEALQAINNLADRNVLSVGQKLYLPNQD